MRYLAGRLVSAFIAAALMASNILSVSAEQYETESASAGADSYDSALTEEGLGLKSSGVSDFESYLTAQGFPESYKPYLRQLHADHPSWIFTAQKTGLNWNDVLAEECVIGRNLVHAEAPDSWKSREKGAYDAETGKWYGLDGTWVAASQGIIAYYLDPRNFLDDSYIFMFENQSYNKSVHNISGVQNILAGTFMSGYFTAPDTGATYSYAQTFMDAAEQSGVSPYHLASRCRNEQGIYGAPQSLGTVPGYENYFNFFDIQAYYTATMTAGQMGCKFAQTTNPTYLLPWTNQYKSIVGGAIYLGNGYINKEQDTLYLQKFDVFDGGNGLYYHQYMTCVFGQANEAVEMKNAYSSKVLASALEFKIPVYNNMPASPCTKPGESGNGQQQTQSPTTELSSNNVLYRFDAIASDGTDLLAAFNGNTTGYSFTVGSGISYVDLAAWCSSQAAKISGTGHFDLAYGDNSFNVNVTAENGSVRTYTLSIHRSLPSGENRLYRFDAIASDGTDLLAAFNGNTSNYSFTVASNISTVSLAAWSYSAAATISGTGNFNLKYGTNVFKVNVTAANGTIRTYTLTVVRKSAALSKGDVNGDSRIDVTDALTIMNYTSGKQKLTAEQLKRADTTGDGYVNVTDALRIMQYVSGKISSL